MIGPGGVELFPPEVYDASVGARRQLDYERGRAYGRFEADNAIVWLTSCIRCAWHLDAQAEGFFQGEHSGLAAALRAVEESTSNDPDTQAVIDVIKAKLSRQLAGYEGMEPWSADTAELRVRKYRAALVRAGFLKHEQDPSCTAYRAQTGKTCAHVYVEDCLTPERP